MHIDIANDAHDLRGCSVLAGAAAELDSILADRPGNPEAINNRAICSLYMTDLTGSIQVCWLQVLIIMIITITRFQSEDQVCLDHLKRTR
jgi:hypothetical protein